jgi:MGT family glycosyltransferase
MAKFTFIVPPLTGHINPTLSLGNELLKRNHTVSWFSLDASLKDQLPEKGRLIVIPIDMDEMAKKKLFEHAQELQKKKVYGIDSLKFLYEEVLTPMNSLMMNGIENALDEFKPDVVISDHQIFAGATASFKKNIPYATSVTAPASIKVNPSFPKIHEWEGEQVIAFQNKFGVSENDRLDCSKLLTLVYTSKEFFGETDLPSNYKFIGPVLSPRSQKIDFDWIKFEKISQNRPKILVSIGTTFDHTQKKQFFNKVVEAFAGENITVIVVSDPDLFENIPDNFIIQKHIPQLEIIQHMQAVVCHGGNNTVCETLSYGIPLIVIPIAYDQSFVSSCVTESGAGIRLNFNRFKTSHLKDAVHSVLNNDFYNKNAKIIQKSFEIAGGVSKGADYLQTLVKN